VPRSWGGEPGQGLHQQIGGKGGVHHQADFRLPAGVQLAAEGFQFPGLLQQAAGPSGHGLAGRGQHPASALASQQFDAQTFLEPGDGVAHRGLAAVQAFGGAAVTSGVDYGQEDLPLFEGGARFGHEYKYSNYSID